jgi:hypothetical protein
VVEGSRCLGATIACWVRLVGVVKSAAWYVACAASETELLRVWRYSGDGGRSSRPRIEMRGTWMARAARPHRESCKAVGPKRLFLGSIRDICDIFRGYAMRDSV